MAVCKHPVQYLIHTVGCPPVRKTHALYVERHQTLCTFCGVLIRVMYVKNGELERRYEDSK